MCTLCDNPDECCHPVSVRPRGGIPKELAPYVGLGNYVDDLDAGDATEEFWENCLYLCHDCMKKYSQWIEWYG